VPADRKWYLHLVLGQIIVQALKSLKLDWPAVTERQKQDLAEGRRLLGGKDTPKKAATSKPVRRARTRRVS